MPKFTLDHLALSQESARLSGQGKPVEAADLLDRRREQAQRAAAFLLSTQNKNVCDRCLLDYAMKTLINMTLPDQADDEDRYQQDRIVTAYLVQEAIDSHVYLDSTEADTPAQPGSEALH